jgi:hypothetical protein
MSTITTSLRDSWTERLNASDAFSHTTFADYIFSVLVMAEKPTPETILS